VLPLQNPDEKLRGLADGEHADINEISIGIATEPSQPFEREDINDAMRQRSLRDIQTGLCGSENQVPIKIEFCHVVIE